MLITRIGPLAQSQTATQTSTKSIRNADPGTVPGDARDQAELQQQPDHDALVTNVTRPKNVGQSFSQRHCMMKW